MPTRTSPRRAGLSAYLAAGYLTVDAATRVLDDQLDRVLAAACTAGG